MEKSSSREEIRIGDILARFGPTLISGGRAVCVVVMLWWGHHGD